MLENFENDYLKYTIIIVIILYLWSIPWRALVLWKAAKHNQRFWFIFFLLVNSAGILEIIYLNFISKKDKPDYKTSSIQFKGFDPKKNTVNLKDKNELTPPIQRKDH
jgi:hypothetical protein